MQFKFPLLPIIETAGEAEQAAIEWQQWQAGQALSYQALAAWQSYFDRARQKIQLNRRVQGERHNMKAFTIIKVGYTSGVYGNSGEYFIAVVINGKKQQSLKFSGQYGPEYRVAEALKGRGYSDFYVNSTYGKLSYRDDRIYFESEHDTIELIKGKEFNKRFKEVK
jgi:hypothetical protein